MIKKSIELIHEYIFIAFVIIMSTLILMAIKIKERRR